MVKLQSILIHFPTTPPIAVEPSELEAYVRNSLSKLLISDISIQVEGYEIPDPKVITNREGEQ